MSVFALVKTNESMTYSANQCHRDVMLHTGDLVYVNTAHFSLTGGISKKIVSKVGRTFSY